MKSRVSLAQERQEDKEGIRLSRLRRDQVGGGGGLEESFSAITGQIRDWERACSKVEGGEAITFIYLFCSSSHHLEYCSPKWESNTRDEDVRSKF